MTRIAMACRFSSPRFAACRTAVGRCGRGEGRRQPGRERRVRERRIVAGDAVGQALSPACRGEHELAAGDAAMSSIGKGNRLEVVAGRTADLFVPGHAAVVGRQHDASGLAIVSDDPDRPAVHWIGKGDSREGATEPWCVLQSPVGTTVSGMQHREPLGNRKHVGLNHRANDPAGPTRRERDRGKVEDPPSWYPGQRLAVPAGTGVCSGLDVAVSDAPAVLGADEVNRPDAVSREQVSSVPGGAAIGRCQQDAAAGEDPPVSSVAEAHVAQAVDRTVLYLPVRPAVACRQDKVATDDPAVPCVGEVDRLQIVAQPYPGVRHAPSEPTTAAVSGRKHPSAIADAHGPAIIGTVEG